MKKEYNEYANKRNIPNLELYTQLLGIFDERRVERDLFAVITSGIVHGFCTITFIVWLRFKVLLLLYIVEILIVIFLSIRNYRINHGKWFKKS